MKGSQNPGVQPLCHKPSTLESLGVQGCNVQGLGLHEVYDDLKMDRPCCWRANRSVHCVSSRERLRGMSVNVYAFIYNAYIYIWSRPGGLPPPPPPMVWSLSSKV